MEKSIIEEKLTTIFRTVFGDDSIVLNEEITASDIDNWDSLTHMLMIAKIEEVFSIKFSLKDLNKLRNVGYLIDIIETKLQ